MRLVRGAQVVDRLCDDRIVRRHQVIEQDADGVDVAAHGRGLAGEHFRRHVERRARDVGTARVFERARFAARAEVHQDDAPGLLAHHVAGLHVAVDEAGVVDGGERAAHVLADEHGFARAEHALQLQHVFERLALHEFHAEADAAFLFLDFEDADDVRLADLRERAAFTQQLRAQTIVGQMTMEDLDGNLAFELRIPGAIDAAEAAFADFLEEMEASPDVHPLPFGGGGAVRDRAGRVGLRGCPADRRSSRWTNPRDERDEPNVSSTSLSCVERCRCAISSRMRSIFNCFRSSSSFAWLSSRSQFTGCPSAMSTTARSINPSTDIAYIVLNWHGRASRRRGVLARARPLLGRRSPSVCSARWRVLRSCIAFRCGRRSPRDRSIAGVRAPLRRS